MEQDKKEQKLAQINKICQLTIGQYAQNIDLSEISFPIFKTTYSLWRRIAYKHVTLQIESIPIRQINKAFNEISQGEMLPKYIEKLTNNIRIASEGYRKLVHQSSDFKQIQSEQQYDLMLSYGALVWKQQLFTQMIEDLARLPYLNIFSQNANLHVKQQYLTVFSKRKPSVTDKVKDKISQTLITKGWGALLNQVLKNNAIFHINTVIGGFNPLMMVLSYGFSYSFDSIRKQANHKQMIQEIKTIKQQAQKKIQKLEETYLACAQLVRTFVCFQGPQQTEQMKIISKKLKKLFFVIFEQEWLNFEIEHDGEWEIVKIQERQNFEQLNLSTYVGN